MEKSEHVLSYFYGVCERSHDGLLAEPLNLLSSLVFFVVGGLIYRHYHRHPDLRDRQIWDVHALTFLMFAIGIGSTVFHAYPNQLTELMDVVPIVIFINLFFLSTLLRIGRTSVFETIVCFLAFGGATHFFVTQFPNAMNDSIGYLSSMGALIMVAIHLHLKRRSSARQFLLASVIGVCSLFFRAIDNAVCDTFGFGTHFLWHCCNALLMYILMKQIIRNVNREARLARVKA